MHCIRDMISVIWESQKKGVDIDVTLSASDVYSLVSFYEVYLNDFEQRFKL